MPAPRALRLLRPLLAPAQSRGGSARGESSCNGAPPPPCPPCEPAPPPPCRARPSAALPGRRVVCCPPPRGARPPCAAAPPPCPLTCSHRLPKVKTPRKEAEKECGGELDRVTQRLRDEERQRRLQYERDVAARRFAPPPPPPDGHCALPPPAERALATDGRSYTVLSAPPPPRCGQPRSCPPPAQPVQLKPPGDCGARQPGVDPCAHRPRVLLSIDRSAGPCPPDDAKPWESPKPDTLPKKAKSKSPASNKGLGSRIMESLGRRADGGCNDTKKGNAKRSREPGWCKSLPKPAPAPPSCREETVAERLRRGPTGPCGGTRRLHTSRCAAITERPPPAPTGRQALLAAAKKLEAALQERDSLKEAGRGRVVAPTGYAPAPPPPSTGALEMRVPPGADTLCVRVSLGAAARGAEPPPTAGCPPTGAPCGGAAPAGGNDAWLSIKNLQKKLSSCGRGEPAAPRAERPAPPAPPARPANPGLCAPRRPIKMTDLVPNTIFTKS